VLAFAATAVPATMDGGGVLYSKKDAFDVARLMAAILDDAALGDNIVQSQDAALARLRARDFAGTLLRFVHQVRAMPPRPAPEVSWDFWSQFDQAERLEELRQFRPAVYRALPEPPRAEVRAPRSGNTERSRQRLSSGPRTPNLECRTSGLEPRTSDR
jgi:hypothetical protein